AVGGERKESAVERLLGQQRGKHRDGGAQNDERTRDDQRRLVGREQKRDAPKQVRNLRSRRIRRPLSLGIRRPHPHASAAAPAHSAHAITLGGVRRCGFETAALRAASSTTKRVTLLFEERAEGTRLEITAA